MQPIPPATSDLRAPAAIEIADVNVQYPGEPPVVALNTASLRVDHGASIAIVGASGSGKSTLLHVMGTLLTPTSGQVLIEGQRVDHLNDNQRAAVRSHHIGFVFQRFHLLSDLDATDNVALGLVYQAVNRRQRRKIAVDALERVGLAHRRNHRPGQLSGGEQQRVAIARALIAKPTIILADEPTGALDTTTSNHIIDTLHHINGEGTAIVTITHDPNVARTFKQTLTIADGHLAAGPETTQR